MSNVVPEPAVISSDTKAIVAAILTVFNHIGETNKKIDNLNKKLDDLIKRKY